MLALPKPEKRKWSFGIPGRLFAISIDKTKLEVRSVLSGKLRLPICALELKKEGVVLRNSRFFEKKTFTGDSNETDCEICGDGPEEGISFVEYLDEFKCRSCQRCDLLCSRCLRTDGLETHCALCLGEDWGNGQSDIMGLRRHWDLMDGGGRGWCRNIVSLYEEVAEDRRTRDELEIAAAAFVCTRVED